MAKTPVVIIVVFLIILVPVAALAQANSMNLSMEQEVMHGQLIPADLDAGTSKLSEGGNYVLEYSVQGGTVPLDAIHSWKFVLKTKDGEPVGGAEISVQGEMPSHEHGMKTKPLMTMALGKSGTGTYIVEGMMFQMPGWWRVTCTIRAGNTEDKVVYNVVIR